MLLHEILKARKGWKIFCIDGANYTYSQAKANENIVVERQKLDYDASTVYIWTKRQ